MERNIPRLAFGSLAVLLLILSAVGPVYASLGKDDQFGMRFDGLMPLNSAGLQSTYTISTDGVFISCPSGWSDVVHTVSYHDTPNDWNLQILIGDGCNGSTNEWFVQAGYFDNNGNFHGVYTLKTYSITNYPSLSGTINIYCSGNVYKGNVYVSQTGDNWPYTFPVTGSPCTADNAQNAWTATETDYQQVGVEFNQNFNWVLSNPNFLVSGAWRNWNIGTQSWHELELKVLFGPLKIGNDVGVQPLASTPGVNVAVQSSQSDGTLDHWCLYGSCPMSPAP